MTKLMNLKCTGVDRPMTGQTLRRYRQTYSRVRWFTSEYKNVLDIAESDFGKKMASELGLSYFYTTGDLDYTINVVHSLNYDYVFCFEVLEHLINPLTFLGNLRECISFDTLVIVTFPRVPHWLKSNRHWKEFTKIEFLTLLDKAGYEIVEYDSFRNFLNFRKYFTGARPVVKLFLQLIGVIKVHFYVIKLKVN